MFEDACIGKLGGVQASAAEAVTSRALWVTRMIAICRDLHKERWSS